MYMPKRSHSLLTLSEKTYIFDLTGKEENLRPRVVAIYDIAGNLI